MNINVRTARYTRTVMRLAIVVIAAMFGHDAMMAMSPHDLDIDASHASHHALVIEQCGTTEGRVLQSSPMPTVSSLADGAAADSALWFVADSYHQHPQVAPVPDASVLRAMLQVFLN